MEGLCIPPSKGLDIEKIAYSTDGYLPQDLNTLVQRALHETSLRSRRQHDKEGPPSSSLITADFENAMTGYRPISLKNISQKSGSSDVLWSDIGGLNAVKDVLIQTLEWPTKYSAIFSSCPLRLRSGYNLCILFHILFLKGHTT
jgi:peroxin-1